MFSRLKRVPAKNLLAPIICALSCTLLVVACDKAPPSADATAQSPDMVKSLDEPDHDPSNPASNTMPGTAKDAAGGDDDQKTSADAQSLDTDDTASKDDAPAACGAFDKSEKTGHLKSEIIDEASGLAASRRYSGYLWTHNDSGDEARIFLIHPDGTLVAEVKLPGIEAVDWEDIAIGPCAPKKDEQCIYIGDTGDNLKKRDHVAVHRIEEPTLPDGHLKDDTEEQKSVIITVDEVHETWFTYPEGPRDVETLMVHPTSAKIYLVEKNTTQEAPVFTVPAAAATSEEPAQATRVATLHLKGLSGLFAMVTGGDISPDGSEFSIRTYLEGFTYCLPQDQDQHQEHDQEKENKPSDFEQIFKVEPARDMMPLMVQGEALAYDLDGQSIWLTSEGKKAPIFRVGRGRAQ